MSDTIQKLSLREIDALAAEKVMGWIRVTAKPGQDPRPFKLKNGACMNHFDVPGFTADQQCAVTLVDRVRRQRAVEFFLHVRDASATATFARIDDENTWSATAPTMPLAITLAALKAHGIEVEPLTLHPGA